MLSSSHWNIPYTLLVSANDYSQFNILQQEQHLLKKLNTIWKALNYYTWQLLFETKHYVLGPNVSAKERKRMICSTFPLNIKSVVVIYLELQNLIWNEILDAYDNVKDETEA